MSKMIVSVLSLAVVAGSLAACSPSTVPMKGFPVAHAFSGAESGRVVSTGDSDKAAEEPERSE
jgi:hypothetical protein